jgi:hypothetical protein
MSVDEVEANILERGPTRAKRPRSAVTSGRKLFVEGNPNSAWSRRAATTFMTSVAAKAAMR